MYLDTASDHTVFQRVRLLVETVDYSEAWFAITGLPGLERNTLSGSVKSLFLLQRLHWVAVPATKSNARPRM
jgi:hypothetical protein